MKTWLITGCSSGFGKRLTVAAARRGDQLVATARDPRSIEDLGAGFGGRLITAHLDVTHPSSAQAAVGRAIDTFGGVNILVPGPSASLPPSARTPTRGAPCRSTPISIGCDAECQTFEHQSAIGRVQNDRSS